MNLLKPIVLFFFILLSCEKSDNFPEKNINISVPITMPMYNNVYNTTWGYDYIDGGVGGIIIVRAINNEFIAYDQACTNEASSECAVIGETINDPILNCSCCTSKFIIIDGSVTEGPANQALKKYNTYFDGVMLYVTN